MLNGPWLNYRLEKYKYSEVFSYSFGDAKMQALERSASSSVRKFKSHICDVPRIRTQLS